MNYELFRKSVGALPLVSRRYLKLAASGAGGLNVQLKRWLDAGKLIRLRKGLYILNQADRRFHPSRMFISKELYSPSYVSTEYALSFYGLIPEKTADITCITSKKTAVFTNSLGRFVYQHLAQGCFRGFLESADEAGLKYFMATPEKAAVDFLYLNQRRFRDDYRLVLTESFRFQNTEILDKNKLSEYAALFNSRKLDRIVTALKQTIHQVNNL
ncbi:MAG: hypothetical protein V1701_05050 [Planctomycetota bacterium]